MKRLIWALRHFSGAWRCFGMVKYATIPDIPREPRPGVVGKCAYCHHWHVLPALPVLPATSQQPSGVRLTTISEELPNMLLLQNAGVNLLRIEAVLAFLAGRAIKVRVYYDGSVVNFGALHEATEAIGA